MGYKHITTPLTGKFSFKEPFGDQETPKYHDVSIIEPPPLTNIIKYKKTYLQAAQGNGKVENKYRAQFY